MFFKNIFLNNGSRKEKCFEDTRRAYYKLLDYSSKDVFKHYYLLLLNIFN